MVTAKIKKKGAVYCNFKVITMANFANVGVNAKVLGQANMARLVVRGPGAHVASTLTTMG